MNKPKIKAERKIAVAIANLSCDKFAMIFSSVVLSHKQQIGELSLSQNYCIKTVKKPKKGLDGVSSAMFAELNSCLNIAFALRTLFCAVMRVRENF